MMCSKVTSSIDEFANLALLDVFGMLLMCFLEFFEPPTMKPTTKQCTQGVVREISHCSEAEPFVLIAQSESGKD